MGLGLGAVGRSETDDLIASTFLVAPARNRPRFGIRLLSWPPGTLAGPKSLPGKWVSRRLLTL
jgi:hypothetical protein